MLIAANWGVFIYAVAIGKLMQASLGYFVNPLISIILGMIFLRERLRPMPVDGSRHRIGRGGVPCVAHR